ncbi:thioredoxin-like protein [Schizopora paradoxa]|uniref:Thioredoxin-like protein n=1 Tax=Schizopora paradoxa TaxID=27342 RepID=A0A0H2S9R0_9AGAM|nr:thioredoxin-like protein [Schizopora paradoxa]
MDLPQPASVRLRTTYRRRRVLWVVALTTILAIVFLAPTSFWDSSSHVHDSKEWASSSGETTPFAAPPKLKEGALNDVPMLKEIELNNLLHMVVSSDRTIPADANPNKPLGLNMYAGEMDTAAWLAEMENDPPLIVFSKTTCPYSKKAKELLGSLDISPPPKIIEVDLRSDTGAMKSLLTRLTKHATFPNVILSGKSLGGYDTIQEMHDEGRLVPLFEEKGLMVDTTPS